LSLDASAEENKATKKKIAQNEPESKSNGMMRNTNIQLKTKTLIQATRAKKSDNFFIGFLSFHQNNFI